MSSESTGNPDGPPILLLHGFLSCRAQWDLNRDRLGERFRLIIVELMGHGRSDTPYEADWYGPAHVLSELDRIRVEHEVDQWWVCGQSLGGAIATTSRSAWLQLPMTRRFTWSTSSPAIGTRGGPSIR